MRTTLHLFILLTLCLLTNCNETYYDDTHEHTTIDDYALIADSNSDRTVSLKQFEDFFSQYVQLEEDDSEELSLTIFLELDIDQDNYLTMDQFSFLLDHLEIATEEEGQTGEQQVDVDI